MHSSLPLPQRSPLLLLTGFCRFSFLALGGLLAAAPAGAAIYDWNADPGGSWQDPANWTPSAPASAFTNADTAQLTKDFTSAAWSLDAAVTLNRLVYEDTGATGDIAGTIDSGIDGTLTLGGTTPLITTNNSLSLSPDLTAVGGFTKNGLQVLTLSGNNTGLSGTLTVADVAGTNSNGVAITHLGALGNIQTVTVQGTTTTGGHFRLSGTGGITVPANVTFNLTGAGGNSAPAGTLISGGTGVNVVEGTINVLNSTVRISNSGATRMDITGRIVATGSNGVVFRQATNEGVHLLNTSNAWTGATIHSGGVLWFEPGTLPNSVLQHAASDPGVIQTNGSFTRSLGNAAGLMFSTYLQAGNRETGFSARGGPLTVNLGGAGADVVFFNFQSLNGTRTSGSSEITGFTNTTGYVTGMVVSGTGIPANATISAVTANSLTLSAAATAAGTTAVVGSTQNNARWQTNVLNLNWDQADSKLTFVNNLDLNGFSRDLSVRANTAEITGIIKNGLAGTNPGIRKLGINGTLTLSNVNNFTGNVDISAGKLRITNSGALGTGAKTITLTNGTAGNPSLLLDGSGGPIDLPANMNLTTSNTLNASSASVSNEAGDNTIRGNFTVTSGGGGTRIASQSGKLTLTGNFTPNVAGRIIDFMGAGDIVATGTIANGSTVDLPVSKRDGGTLTLSGTSTYTGATTLEGGLTLVNGALANTPVTVRAGATLGGSGSIAGPVTVESGGNLSPGNSPGKLSTGPLQLQAQAAFLMECHGPVAGQSYDQVRVHGGVKLHPDARFILRPGLWNPRPSDVVFPLLNDGTDPIDGQFAAFPEGSILRVNGQPCRLSYQGNGDHGPVANDLSLTFLPDETPSL